ncbi:CTD kinase-I gamma subunit [Metschnikowia bicuspidata var. bicuspidata NRRL YB-4993]|uniref:CTD kinase-I gamma subunit n=1 Tax=Metschnikowia bicuspidata var. bicuspidata NRRL YB-4993 TaxID=869754 RepID=A0A1A0HCM6_9ASCO|nr:CTD kinase-I gamma subunit [Metschnikowia bicuspidata var. bicuspidata NRRL YB-4993]OBA21745.1 CTD kinase-I gamma subunit [Metschnikowia bicuspidata var. bicuspidata NRRL YB-4993]
MDSFETSSQFVQILKSLVPQAQSLLKAAHYALKNAESEDYLYYAIIDILEDQKVELNTKSTIFQFIDILIHESFHASQQAHTNYNYPYVHNLKNLLPKILIKVLPSNSNANLFNIHDNLKNISEALNVNYSDFELKFNDVESSLTDEELENVNMNIPYPEITLEDMKMEYQDPVLQAWQILLKKRQQSHYERLRLLKHEPFKDGEVTEDDMFLIRPSRPDPLKKINENLLSRKQILARMEDDRETHKKSKETLWLVSRPSGANTVSEDEFLNYYWDRMDKVSDAQAGEFFGAFDELNKLAGASYKDPQF